MSDDALRALRRRAIASPNDAEAALAYVRALARIEAPPACAYEGCGKPGVGLAQGRSYTWRPGHELGFYCERHVGSVSDEGDAEYTVNCPACGCAFGVN